jgi:succinoglycan biosynthesis protein ExoA
MKQKRAIRATLVSVIMPVRNEEPFIRSSLDAVLAQDYPRGRIEVIVADGMSTDRTRAIVRSLQATHRQLFLIDNPGQIVPTGLNAAIAKAKGDVIIRIDGHCKVAPDYVRRCVEHLERDRVDAVGGPIETVGETPTARVIAAATSSMFGVGGSAFRTTSDITGFSDTVPFPAYTRAIIQRAGPYDEELVRNQDDEYNYRLRKLGAKVLLASDVRSVYFSRSSLKLLWRQYFQYGYWKVRVMQKHPKQMSFRHFVPAAFVAILGAALLAAPFVMIGDYIFVAVAGSYIAATALATFLAGKGVPPGLLPLLPGAFATIHLAYGVGFIAGLVKFRNRWGKS